MVALMAAWIAFGLGTSLSVLLVDGAWRSVGADLVLRGASPGLAAPTAGGPPLQALLQMPVGLVPGLAGTILPGVLVASVAAALVTRWMYRLLRGVALLNRATALALTTAFAAHPVLLYAVVTGSGEVVAAALLLAATHVSAVALARRNVWLAALAAALLGMAGLARLDLLLLGATLLPMAAALLAAPKATLEERLATAVAVAMPLLFPLGFWLIVTLLEPGAPVLGTSFARGTGQPASALPGWHYAALLMSVPLGVGVAAATMPRARVSRSSLLWVTVATTLVGVSSLVGPVLGGSPWVAESALPGLSLSLVLLGLGLANLSSRRYLRGFVMAAAISSLLPGVLLFLFGLRSAEDRGVAWPARDWVAERVIVAAGDVRRAFLLVTWPNTETTAAGYRLHQVVPASVEAHTGAW